MSIAFPTASTILDILLHPEGRAWSIQGLGMLRLYLDDEHTQRLHLWNPDAAYARDSTVHDHPWDFDSLIVSGNMLNIRYETSPGGAEYVGQDILCGEGGGVIAGTERRTRLKSVFEPNYLPGEVYHQDAPDLHESSPTPGTVTVINRSFHQNRDVAHVYWPSGEWTSAEPRPATPDEVETFTNLALAHWERP